MESKENKQKKTKGEEFLEERILSERSVTLKECIDYTNKFISGEIDTDEFDKFSTRIKVRMYLPIITKMQMIMTILTGIQVNTGLISPEIVITELYRDVFFKVLLGQYAQIDLGSGNYQTYDNYDILYPIFEPYIKQYCERDFNLFMDMLKDSISLYGITNVTDSVEKIDGTQLKQATESNREMVKSLKEHKDLISDLRDIMFSNDKVTKEFVESVKKTALENANKVVKENRDSKDNENNKRNENNKNDDDKKDDK